MYVLACFRLPVSVDGASGQRLLLAGRQVALLKYFIRLHHSLLFVVSEDGFRYYLGSVHITAARNFPLSLCLCLALSRSPMLSRCSDMLCFILGHYRLQKTLQTHIQERSWDERLVLFIKTELFALKNPDGLSGRLGGSSVKPQNWVSSQRKVAYHPLLDKNCNIIFFPTFVYVLLEGF